MARTDLTAQAATRSGLSTAFDPAIADGHQFVNNGRRSLRFKNTNAAARTVTVLHPSTASGNAVTGTAIVVPALTGDVETAFWPASFNQVDGKVYLDYSATADLTVAVVERSTAG